MNFVTGSGDEYDSVQNRTQEYPMLETPIPLLHKPRSFAQLHTPL